MTNSVDAVTFEPRELKDGSGWYVLVTYPDGPPEHIPDFASEVEARDWIASNAQDWLKRRGYGGK
jgi:hypothetical protein